MTALTDNSDAIPDQTLWRQAYVTLLTGDHYLPGALTLGASLRETGTERSCVVLVTPQVSVVARTQLTKFWALVDITLLDSQDTERLTLIGRPELGVTLSKLYAWRLTQFDKCVFLDADTLVLCNVDELFLRDELSAAPDIGWPDCFNSGVFVYKPSLATCEALLQLAKEEGSFDGGDQGLLNSYWPDWSAGSAVRLPFIYNVGINTTYFYSAAIAKYRNDIKILHFVGLSKPWTQPWHSYALLHGGNTMSGVNVEMRKYTLNNEFYTMWWSAYNRALASSSSCPSNATTTSSTTTTTSTTTTPTTTTTTTSTSSSTTTTTSTNISSTTPQPEVPPTITDTLTRSNDSSSNSNNNNNNNNNSNNNDNNNSSSIGNSNSNDSIESNTSPVVPPAVDGHDSPPAESNIPPAESNIPQLSADETRRLSWQHGIIDIAGKDASDIIVNNILQKINSLPYP